ncbi:MAG: hypothetical protein HYZ11_01510 [Candidatus Tectomicrobia bacterium]|uniref:ABM domain-containing protein n=1 Tax=Tectimicrobiota bacterium TaxID=2528274 RepID=A0A932MM79_UNCTE|nr:hypothetical protein [Candidatus Tectomicrobia bacterium]
MHSRIGIWEGSPEELERWIARSREQVKPDIQKDPGLAAAYWLVDRSRGRGMIVTLWESREAMEASEQARLKRQSGTTAATGARVATERYKVVDSLVM